MVVALWSDPASMARQTAERRGHAKPHASAWGSRQNSRKSIVDASLWYRPQAHVFDVVSPWISTSPQAEAWGFAWPRRSAAAIPLGQ
ncbi:MAG: hypothetical protein K2G92_09190 [Duncaniella sp.]|nr:hypothetical protein [Duncaniella sp.]